MPQKPGARRFRKRVSGGKNRYDTDWDKIFGLYSMGYGLTEIGAKTNIPSGTIRAYASRHKWAQKLKSASKLMGNTLTRDMIDPRKEQELLTAITRRASEYQESLSKIAVKMGNHFETLKPKEILAKSSDFERVDKVNRRSLMIDKGTEEAAGGNKTLINLSFLQDAPVQVVGSDVSESGFGELL